MYMPSGNGLNGTPTPAIIYAIVLFLEFPDDITGGAAWPKLTSPVGIMQDIIDGAPNAPSGKKYNITTYFRDMSAGKLVIVGQPVYKKTRYSLAQYQLGVDAQSADDAGYPGDASIDFSDKVRYWAIKHALEELDLQNGFDFSPFDRWTINGLYNYANVPDGRVDMIFACFRGNGSRIILNANGNPEEKQDQSFIGLDGVANLGSSNPADNFVVNLNTQPKLINFGLPWDLGSGVTTAYMADYPNKIMPVFHEFGHYLGLQHQYNGGVWSLMAQVTPNVSSCANSYERIQMGWMTPTTVSADGEIATLRDFATTYSAYRIPVEPNFDQYFLVENHQRLNSPFITRLPDSDGRSWGNIEADPYWNVRSYDVTDQSSGDGAPGLYILQQNGSQVSVVCADGRWSWKQAPCQYGPYLTVGAPWNPNQPLAVWDRDVIDRAGGDCDRQAIKSWKTCEPTPQFRQPDFMWAWRDPATLQVVNTVAKHRGDTRDRWHLGEEPLTPTETTPTGYNIFTQWSNPSTRSLSGNTTVGMEVLGKTGTDYTVKFYLTSAVDAAPSIPQDLKVYPEDTWCHDIECPDQPWTPRITWVANTEPDVNPNGTYEIWRRNEPGGITTNDWVYVTTLSGGTTSCLDDAVWARGPGEPATGDWVRYKIRAIDGQGKKSIFSEERVIEYTAYYAYPKRLVNSSELPGLSVGCSPNPFSESTTIHYRLPADGVVTLTIFDPLGREVAKPVDGMNQAGEHGVTFNAENLPAGIYTWRLQFRGATMSDRLVVMR
jgi:M6 family metalloprotease-like protein